MIETNYFGKLLKTSSYRAHVLHPVEVEMFSPLDLLDTLEC